MISKLRSFILSEAFRYMFVGGCTTLVNMVVFFVLCEFLGFDTSNSGITIANVISIICAIFFAYVANKIFVFSSITDSKRELFLEFVKFVSARLITMIIEVGGVYLAVSLLRQDEMIGKIETQIIVLVANFFISKYLVFKGENANDK